jgi:putative flippase GtrA
LKKSLIRFLKYFLIGFSTFLLDLFLLYFFTDILLINYLVSTAIAFIISITIHYHFSRKFVFSKTTRGIKHGYYIFLGTAILGLMFVVLLMALLVEKLFLNYIIARVIVAGVVGMYNYLVNLFFNFKVVGNH